MTICLASAGRSPTYVPGWSVHQPGRDDKPTEDSSNQSLRLPGHSGLQGRKQLYTDSARLTPPDLPGSQRLTSPRMDMLSVLSTPCTNPTACHMATR